MGGNALKLAPARRIAAAEYHALVPRLLDIIHDVVGQDRPVAAIQSYRTKPDFGDCDILVASDNIRRDYEEELAKRFASKEYSRNAPPILGPLRAECATSFEVDGFQVDVITQPNQNFEFALQYYAWNDLGNLCGRIANKLGLKFGFQGLVKQLKEGDRLYAEIVVTRDFDSALKFLGYDPVRHRKGFDTMQEIFEYAASSPFFNPDIFLLENRNAVSRVRDAKRKTYRGFLEWCAADGGLGAEDGRRPSDGWYAFPENREVWLGPLRNAFPSFGDELDLVMAQKARREVFKAAFNGEAASKVTGLTGAPLGALLADIRLQFKSDHNLQSWVLGAKPGELEELFISHSTKLAKPALR